MAFEIVSDRPLTGRDEFMVETMNILQETGAEGTKRTAGKNVGHENTSPSGLRPATSPQGEAFEEN